MEGMGGHGVRWAVAAALAAPGVAHAFAEDVCFDENGARNCSEIPEQCLPVGTDDARCRAAASAAFVVEGSSATAARSTLHADATHLIAQFVGFSAEDAWWIAAYDEVADYSSFDAMDREGLPYGDGAYATATLDGFNRLNLPSGGMLFHFMAPFHGADASPIPGIDGLDPDPTDGTTEVQLANLRAWALGDAPGCTAGLTVPVDGDYARGPACYSEDGEPVPVHGEVRGVGSVAIPFNVVTGPQVIVSSDTAPITTEGFDAVVGEDRAADARLGVYLHSLADRISHHVCADTAHLSLSEDGFSYDATSDDCTQGTHALRHLWEAGVDPDVLSAADRTTPAALETIADELADFAGYRGVYRADRDTDEARTALLRAIGEAIALPNAGDRIDALAAVACDAGVAPFPGMPACLQDPEPEDTDVPDDTDVGRPRGCTGAAAPVGAWLVFASIAATLRRRRAGR